MPTFSRRTDTDTTAGWHPPAGGTTVAGPDETTVARWGNSGTDDRERAYRAGRVDTAELRTDDIAAAGYGRAGHPDPAGAAVPGGPQGDRPPVATGPRPRASLLATLGLILGVASALLVLSGPLLGYGMVLAGPALVLSLLGLRATRRRHVAGKSDALIGMLLSLAALVVGGLALTGSLSWLGTDLQPVGGLRDWLDARLVDRF